MTSLPARALHGDRAFLLGGALVVLTGFLVLRPLAVTWSSIDNYSYGWFIPLVAAYFFAERWATRPTVTPGPTGRTPRLFFLGGLLLFLLLRPLLESDPTWRLGLWLLMALYVGLSLGWLARETGAGCMRHFAFPVLLLFLCVPWPATLEDFLVLGLMRTNALWVHHALALFGVATQVSGHIIVLPNCRVGVDEACSGIISLQASLMMGCVLGEIYRLSIARRIVLALVPMAFALAGNFGRTFFLSAVAVDGGAPAVTRWHDSAGYSLVIFTGVATWLLALILSHTSRPPQGALAATAGTDPGAPPSGAGWRWAVCAFAVALAAEGATQAWFGWRKAHLPHRAAWTVNFSAQENFQPLSVGPEIKHILNYHAARSGHWQDARGWNWTAFWFYYLPKPGIDAVLNWHNPMACLPSAGWRQEESYAPFPSTVNGIALETRALRFSHGSEPIDVFWLIYPLSGVLPAALDETAGQAPRHPTEDRLLDVWRGYRGVGMETLEVVVEGAPDEGAARAAYEEQLKKIIDSHPPAELSSATSS